MLLRNFCILTLLAVQPVAFAEQTQSGSEHLYQPALGQHALTAALYYGVFKLENGVLGRTTTKEKGNELAYQYGISEVIAVGIRLGYSISDPDDSGSFSGPNDIRLTLNGRTPVQSTLLRYGAELQLSPGDSEKDSNGNSENQYSGQHILTPYFGAEWTMAPVLLGVKLNHEFNLTDKTTKDDTGAKTKTSGGETTSLEVFAETRQATNLFGGALTYSVIADTKNKNTGTKSESRSPTWLARGYGAFELKDNLTLLPAINYLYIKHDIRGFEIKYSGWLLEAALRFTF